MKGAVGPSGTLGEVLALRRRRQFVGRTSELALFQAVLDHAEPPFSVLHIHGPGGIGKTSLVDAFAALAVDAGASVARIDGHSLHPSPSAFLEALAECLDVSGGEDAITARPGAGRAVILLDTYERLLPLDDWLRTVLIPRLPATAVTVIAGRDPPTPAWRGDQAWGELLRVLSLRNWSPEESWQYLDACGVDPGLRDQLVQTTHGHPFGLSLLVDVAARGGEPGVDPLAPDLVGALLARFLDVVPSALHRRALEVCALARVTTEPLLRDALGLADAHELFTWLRGLSFIESAPDGVFPHDLARDAVDADLRWRDLDGYKQVFRAVRAHIHRCLTAAEGHEQQRLLFDEKFLFRHYRAILAPLDWDSWGRHYPQPAGPDDRNPILELARRWEGAESAAIVEHWFERQPEGFSVLRRPGGAVRGFVTIVDLTRASTQDIAADPGTRAAWDHAHRHAPPRPGEIVTQCRFVIDDEAYQAPSPTLNATPILTIQRYLHTPTLAWDFLTLAEPDRWDDYFAVADLPRVAGADFTLGGRRYGLFAHDFRQVPVHAWLELVTERALARDDPVPPPARSSLTLVLSHGEFGDAVRQALRDLHRPDLLARNPLLRTRLLRERAGRGEPDAATLDAVLRQGVATLRDHPRNDKLWRAVDRTYLRPAATQERAAAALGLPFSTYRRHLTQGLTRVVSWLWDLEVYGAGEQQ